MIPDEQTSIFIECHKLIWVEIGQICLSMYAGDGVGELYICPS